MKMWSRLQMRMTASYVGVSVVIVLLVELLLIVIFLVVANIERWRVGRYFWNQLGLEYTLMWTIAACYFLVHGGGIISLDRLIGRAF